MIKISRISLAASLTIGLVASLIAPGIARAQAPSQLRTERAAAMQNWAHSLALQAATWGSPLVTRYHLGP